MKNERIVAVTKRDGSLAFLDLTAEQERVFRAQLRTGLLSFVIGSAVGLLMFWLVAR